MVPKIPNYKNLPKRTKIGLSVVGGCIVAAMASVFAPIMKVLLVIIIGLVFVVLLLLIYWCLLKWRKKRKAASLEHGVIVNASVTPQGVSETAQLARLDDLRKKFEEGIAKFQKSLYSVPWYVIVGEPGSGKTEAIRHCNVGFPIGLQDRLQGTGGTVNMHWWYTNHAVILDTAGRLMFEEVETGGSGEWKEFLKLLKKYRPRCPINGMFLVIPADSLIKDTADEIEWKASKIARQFDVIQRTLDVRFPVFVVITKSDLINGFRDFFENVEDINLQHQILGWSNPAPLDEPYNPEFIDQHLEAIQMRLFRRRLALLQEIVSESKESGLEGIRTPETLYAFPQSVAKIAPRMARYLELIFGVGSQWSCKPLFFRGIYFTSSMREGSALDEDLAESLGVSVDSLPDGRVWERDRAYFLRDLFIKKVFLEKGLVTHATNANKQHMRRRAAVLISAIASIVILLGFTVYGSISFKRSIGNMKDYFGAVIDNGMVEKNEVIQLNSQTKKYEYYRDPYKVKGKEVRNTNFSKRLAEEVNRYIKDGPPWIFKLAIPKELKPENLNEAQKAIYEMNILRPILIAACNMLRTEPNDSKWTKEDPSTRALLQLIRLKAKKPLLNNGERYSKQEFLVPLYEYVFKDDEKEEIEACNKDKVNLHEPISLIYENWPPKFIEEKDPNSISPLMISAINKSITNFNDYWSHVNQVSTQIEIVKNLGKDLDRFDANEAGILSLHDGLTRTSGRHDTIEQLYNFADKWNERFEKLKEAKVSADSYVIQLKSSQPLQEIWKEVVSDVEQDVNENYNFILSKLKDINEPFINEIRKTLGDSNDEVASRLRDPNFEGKLKKYDEKFYLSVESDPDNRRLYEIRYDMYEKAYNLNTSISTGLPSEQSRNVYDRFTNAKNAIVDLCRLYDSDRLLQESVEDFQSSPEMTQTIIAISSLRNPPENVEDIESRVRNLSENQGKTSFNYIPADFNQEYDPIAADVIFDAWNSLDDILKGKEYLSVLKVQYDDSNDYFQDYADKYVAYWLYDFPDNKLMIPSKTTWKEQLNQLEDTNLKQSGLYESIEAQRKEIYEKAIEDRTIVSYVTNKRSENILHEFEKDKDNVAPKAFKDNSSSLLDAWANLPSDPFKARDTLLKLKSIKIIVTYFPFAGRSEPGAFSKRLFQKLAYDSLVVLVNDCQDKGMKKFDQLMKYSGEFPLMQKGKGDLAEKQLYEAQKLFQDIQPAYSVTAVDSNELEYTEINEKLMMLSQPSFVDELPQSERTMFENLTHILKGLPEGKDPYYCKVYLLGEEGQKERLAKDEKLLTDKLRSAMIVQKGSRNKRFRTGEKDDKEVAVVSYPGPSIQISFYQYSTDEKPIQDLVLEFGGPWACLRMLRPPYYNGDKGYVKLNVGKKENLGGTLFLRLEFYKDHECKVKIENFPPHDWYH